MRKLFEQLPSAVGESSASALAVIERFDALTTEEASLDALVAAAAELTGAAAAVDDALNGRRAASDVAAVSQRLLDFLEGSPSTHGPSHEGMALTTPYGDTVVASIDAGSGHIGWALLTNREQLGSIHDLLVGERLAAAAAVEALRFRSSEQSDARIDPASVERLLTAGLSPEDAAYLARRARMNADVDHVVLAIGDTGLRPRAPDVLAGDVLRFLREHHVGARACVIDRRAIVVAEAGAALDRALAEIASDPPLDRIRVGVGTAQHIEMVAVSRAEAVDALLLGDVVGLGPVLACEDLGTWKLLLRIPADEILATADVQAVHSLHAPEGGLSDHKLLGVFCRTGSLRQTAACLHLHHSSVKYRLARIESTLGFDLDAEGRMRAMLAIRMLSAAQSDAR